MPPQRFKPKTEYKILHTHYLSRSLLQHLSPKPKKRANLPRERKKDTRILEAKFPPSQSVLRSSQNQSWHNCRMRKHDSVPSTAPQGSTPHSTNSQLPHIKARPSRGNTKNVVQLSYNEGTSDSSADHERITRDSTAAAPLRQRRRFQKNSYALSSRSHIRDLANPKCCNC